MTIMIENNILLSSDIKQSTTKTLIIETHGQPGLWWIASNIPHSKQITGLYIHIFIQTNLTEKIGHLFWYEKI